MLSYPNCRSKPSTVLESIEGYAQKPVWQSFCSFSRTLWATFLRPHTAWESHSTKYTERKGGKIRASCLNAVLSWAKGLVGNGVWLDSSFVYINNRWCNFPWCCEVKTLYSPTRHHLGLVPNLMWHYSSLFSPAPHFWAELFILPLKNDSTNDQTQGREREDHSVSSVMLENPA